MPDVNALNEAVAANYLLVDLRIRSWSGKSTDRTASQEVLGTHQARSDGGSFVKNLLAGARDEMKLVHSLGAALRNFVHNRTLPWSSAGDDGRHTGERLLASSQAMVFLTELNGLKKDYDTAVLALQAVWPERVKAAMVNLGTLANADDYPNEADIPSLFSVAVDIRPVPAVSDYARLNVPAALADALGARSAAQAQVQVRNALDDMQGRFVEELTRIHTQLGKHGTGEKTRLYGSLITNMQGLVQIARNMNLNNSPRLSELADKIDAQLLACPIEAYKDDPLRAAAASRAAKELLEEVQLPEVWEYAESPGST